MASFCRRCGASIPHRTGEGRGPCCTHLGECYLAKRWCDVSMEPAVCQSGAGYYIGCTDPETGEPISRESVEYFPTAEAAQAALDAGTWTQRSHP
jgi:hypothetical protein